MLGTSRVTVPVRVQYQGGVTVDYIGLCVEIDNLLGAAVSFSSSRCIAFRHTSLLSHHSRTSLVLRLLEFCILSVQKSRSGDGTSRTCGGVAEG